MGSEITEKCDTPREKYSEEHEQRFENSTEPMQYNLSIQNIRKCAMRLVAAFCLLLTGSVFASESGFYVGGKFGVESVTNKLESSSVTIDSIGSEGTLYGVFVGYNIPISSDLYWGVELEHLSHDVAAAYEDDGYKAEISLENEYGVGLLFGNRFSDNVNIY
ncbi:outer membrane beta-barrel protein [Endozoicomonas sp.]|uniref:outer membrane beta-barrel protein n=1 Tax=Endozoicomonas sp. TaxID=1892382 RepID=UPI00383B7100